MVSPLFFPIIDQLTQNSGNIKLIKEDKYEEWSLDDGKRRIEG